MTPDSVPGDEVRRIVLVAEDCPAQAATPPPPGRTGRSVAQVQYELLAAEPFRWTENDVLFESWWRRQEFPDGEPDPAEKARIREQWIARPRPCLRASPLPMRYGWGLVFDEHDHVALCPVDSEQYRVLASGEGGIEVQRSFRSRRRR